MNLFKKTFSSLNVTRDKMSNTFKRIFNKSNLSDADYEKIEECLLESDVSWNLTEKVIENIKNNHQDRDWENSLKEIFKDVLDNCREFSLKKNIIMIGVNGAGKTTSSAKLANLLKTDSEVCLVAADTFRAAAVEQLKLWSDRINVDCIANSNTSDPASIAYDGVSAGNSRKLDHVIIDTAGRLHTSSNLMNELEKIYRVISKITDDISIVMNLDANIGQNAIKQVEEFNNALPIDGLILNKMDGTAKGGIAISICDKFKIPIIYLGVGEKKDSIIPFNAENYIDSLISVEDSV